MWPHVLVNHNKLQFYLQKTTWSIRFYLKLSLQDKTDSAVYMIKFKFPWHKYRYMLRNRFIAVFSHKVELMVHYDYTKYNKRDKNNKISINCVISVCFDVFVVSDSMTWRLPANIVPFQNILVLFENKPSGAILGEFDWTRLIEQHL